MLSPRVACKVYLSNPYSPRIFPPFSSHHFSSELICCSALDLSSESYYTLLLYVINRSNGRLGVHIDISFPVNITMAGVDAAGLAIGVTHICFNLACGLYSIIDEVGSASEDASESPFGKHIEHHF